MPKRTQSPSSIKTYLQCPRKYYFQYILKLETKSNIHQACGSIAHSVLENFFDANIEGLTKENCQIMFQLAVQDLLVKFWKESEPEFQEIGIDITAKFSYFEQSLVMLLNWANNFSEKLSKMPGSIIDNFKELTPVEREQEYSSPQWAVRGFIDVVEKTPSGIAVMDYKTSNSTNIDEHKLQLAMYSLLYSEKHGKLPEKAGIYFLKAGVEKFVGVDEELLEYAKAIISEIHKKTEAEKIEEYPEHRSPLCKWATGQCDFYEYCYSGKKVEKRE